MAAQEALQSHQCSDAGEPQDHAGELRQRQAVVGGEGMVEQQRGEGTEAHEDRRHVRLDMLLPPGNQQEWQAGAE